jgi:hypothetical protein
MSLDVPPKLAALFQAIHNPEQPDRPFTDEITDDLEAEGETLVDDIEPMADVFDVSKLKEFLLDASKGVTNETEKEYKRFITFKEINMDWLTTSTQINAPLPRILEEQEFNQS